MQEHFSSGLAPDTCLMPLMAVHIKQLVVIQSKVGKRSNDHWLFLILSSIYRIGLCSEFIFWIVFLCLFDSIASGVKYILHLCTVFLFCLSSLTFVVDVVTQFITSESFEIGFWRHSHFFMGLLDRMLLVWRIAKIVTIKNTRFFFNSFCFCILVLFNMVKSYLCNYKRQ